MFLGLRYEVVGAWHEKSDRSRTSCPIDGGHHVVPNDEVAAKLPPGLIALDRTLTADEVGPAGHADQRGQEQLQPARRLRLAARREQQDRAARRLRPVPPDRRGAGHSRPAGDQRVPLHATRDAAAACATASRRARRPSIPTDFGNQGIDPNLESPDIYQYNLTLERELPGDLGLRVSYIGSTMRKLLVDRDFNTHAGQHRAVRPASNPDDLARLPFPLYGFYMDIVGNRGEGQFHAAQLELLRRWRGGLAFNVAYTLAHSDSNAPDTGNSTIGPVQFDPYDIEKDRGPDPNVVKHRVVANATWDIPVGRGRKHGANMSGWADALFGGWTVSTIVPGAQRPEPHAVLQRLLHDEPVEHRQAARRPRQLLLLRLAAGPDQGSQHRRVARRVLRSDRVCDSRPRQTRQREEGQPEGPGHLGRELRVLQGRRLQARCSGCSSRRCSTTRSTIRSSSRPMGAASSI